MDTRREGEGTGGSPSDTGESERSLHSVVRTIRRLGVRGPDADALALEILFPAGKARDPTGVSTLGLRSRVRNWRRAGRRRREREAVVAVAEGETGPWKAPPTRAETSELRRLLVDALRAAVRAFEREELALFARRSLAREEGEATGSRSGTTRLERRVRAFLVGEVMQSGVEAEEVFACPGAGRILMAALRLWVRPPLRKRSPAGPEIDPHHRKRRAGRFGGPYSP
jgi:hypothetical protein